MLLAFALWPALAAAQMPAKEWAPRRKVAVTRFTAGSQVWNAAGTKESAEEYRRLEALRLEGIAAAADADRAESATLLFEFARREHDERTHVGSPQVLEALVEALARHGSEAARAVLVAHAQRDPDLDLRLYAIRALGRLDGPAPDGDRALAALFDDRDLRVRIRATEAAGRRRIAALRPRLLERLADPIFALGWAAMNGLEGWLERADVLLLIDALPRCQGRLGARVRAALRALTGGDFGQDAPSWRAWWRSKLATEAAGGGTATVAPPDYANPDEPTYYGLRVESRHVVFVVDTSGSMMEPASPRAIERARVVRTGPRGPAPVELPERATKADVARAEVIRAVWDLPEDTWFNLVQYANGASRWQPVLVPATEQHRREALEWARKNLGAWGGTNIWAGLETALTVVPPDRAPADRVKEDLHHPFHYEHGPDTLYFLTDGRPTGSKYSSPEEHVAALARLNAARFLIVNTVGIGVDHDRDLLTRLAEVTGGSYLDAEQ